MATRTAITKQLARVWIDASTVNAQAHQKLTTLVSSQGIYTFYDIIDTHPYSALAKLVDDMQAQFKLLAESALAIEIDGVRVGVEADRIAASLIAKNQPPNVEIDLLRSITAVGTASLDVHDFAKILVETSSIAQQVETTCSLAETKKQLLNTYRKKALSAHLEVPYIDMKPTAKSAVRNHLKLTRMLLHVTVNSDTVGSALEQLMMLLTLTSDPLASRVAGLAKLKAL
jgi:hypothetical protein